MKALKNILAIVVLSVIALGANAQTNISANIAASAEVMTALTITKNVDVNFGKISSTTPGNVVLDPTGVTNDAYVGETRTKGKFTISAANTSSIEINWPATLTLEADAPTQAIPGYTDLTLTFDVNGYTTDVPASSADLTTPANVTCSGSGAYFLFVGGSLGTLSSQTPGLYEGTATFTVEYN
ncbi:MAG: DUF4402 domain-containing protein [Bacteroidales bacterium]|nr:DUF4402 domain-containing protein [Bacteroidales bacterium]